MSQKSLNFDSLEEAINCYGRANLIPIDNLQQSLFYIKSGCQPRFVWEKEGHPGRVTFWFLKSETLYVYKKWQEKNPKRNTNV